MIAHFSALKIFIVGDLWVHHWQRKNIGMDRIWQHEGPQM
jgi:hypothetical protein